MQYWEPIFDFFKLKHESRAGTSVDFTQDLQYYWLRDYVYGRYWELMLCRLLSLLPPWRPKLDTLSSNVCDAKVQALLNIPVCRPRERCSRLGWSPPQMFFYESFSMYGLVWIVDTSCLFLRLVLALCYILYMVRARSDLPTRAIGVLNVFIV